MAIRTTTHQASRTSHRGFASMDPERLEEVARKGGLASAEKAGHEGMVARGRLGGKMSAERAGHQGMSERGRQGGIISSERAGYKGMSERGRLGGEISSNRRSLELNKKGYEDEEDHESEAEGNDEEE